ncbi:hypothetical protein GH733_006857 [Mirounga leonina]|nr:hypothetical protein GH733_006857 [Mirounga leonina]
MPRRQAQRQSTAQLLDPVTDLPLQSKATKLEKPSRTATSPRPGGPLRMSDLARMRSSPFACSSDSVPCLTPLPWPSGAVVTWECERTLVQQDAADPVNGEKLLDHARPHCAVASDRLPGPWSGTAGGEVEAENVKVLVTGKLEDAGWSKNATVKENRCFQK